MPLLDHFSLIAPFYDRWFQSSEPDNLRSILDLPVSAEWFWMRAEEQAGSPKLLQAMAASFVIADESFGMLRQALSQRFSGAGLYAYRKIAFCGWFFRSDRDGGCLASRFG